MPEDIEIIGEAQLDRAIEQFTPAMRGEVWAPALRDAASTFVEAVRRSARSMFQAKTGRLFSEIDKELQVSERPGGGAVLRWKIGIVKSAHKPYPRFWNEGFVHIGRGKSRSRILRRAKRKGQGAPIGKFMRRDFMRPAFESVYRAVVQRVFADARAGVERVAQRIYRKVA